MARKAAKRSAEVSVPARERIVGAAARLFLTRGYHGTSVDEVLAASDTGKSQFYHYFPSKEALVVEVLRFRQGWLRERQLPQEDHLDSYRGIAQWLDGWVRLLEQAGCAAACPVGQIGAEAGVGEPEVRAAVATVYGTWRQLLAAGLTAMKKRGQLVRDADPAGLADLVLTAAQGGTLLAKMEGSTAPMRRSNAQVLAHLRAQLEDSRAH